MLLDQTSPELRATEERFARQQARTVRDQGGGATVGGLELTRRFTPTLAEAIETTLRTQSRRRRRDDNVARLLRGLEPETLAVCVLQTVLSCIAREAPLVATQRALAREVHNELWADQLKEHVSPVTRKLEDGTTETKMVKGALAARIDKHVREKHGNLRYRRVAARAIAKRAGFSPRKDWAPEEQVTVGQFLINVLLRTFPSHFEVVHTEGKATVITVTDAAVADIERVQRETIRRNPVFLPSALPPVPWTDWGRGGPVDPRMQRSTSVVRSHRAETASLVRAAVKEGTMQPTLDALNAIQATPWRINKRVLVVMQQCIAQGIEVPSLPRAENYKTPDKPRPWADMTDAERELWKHRAAGVEKANRTLKSERMRVTEDMVTDEKMAALPRFYTPCNADWRGRVYPLPHFNFQRNDRVRGLFEFADGMPLTEEGLYWLKVHVANTGDFGKIKKRPYDERVKWVDENMVLIRDIASWPIGFLKWTEADKPFSFLAGCMELVRVETEGLGCVSHLPTSWDGSCSGLQHLCAATRAPEGSYVNLTPQSEPQDVYQTVADAVNVGLMQDSISGNPKVDALAKMCLSYGIDRKVVKRNVMTFAYSSKKFGMSKQLQTDLMEPLHLKVLAGELEKHPFGNDKGYAASKYLAGKVYAAIKRTVSLPAQAMEFLQALARTLAHEGKPLSWTTPAGLPWVNRYHEVTTKQVRLWLHDRGVDVPYQVVVATGEQKPIAKEKAANGVAPNFVHALDASHLLLTVNAAVAEGITNFALVHDSFGCHASHAARFQRIIREQFVQMYEKHDVLAEVLERAKCDLTNHNVGKLPNVLPRGDLNIKEVLDADYAFS